jgi:hypothetical protein
LIVKTLTKKPGYAGLFSCPQPYSRASYGMRNSSASRDFTWAKFVAPNARRAVAANPVFRIKACGIRFPDKMSEGVTLKKNLEKLRFANHLSP